MTSLVLVVGPASGVTGPGVLDLLRDWSAAGLVGDFVWVEDVDLADGTDLQVPAWVVRRGTAARRPLIEHLADQTALDAVRLVVLSAPGVDDAVSDPQAAATLFTRLTQGFDGTVAIHLLAPRQGMGRWRADVGWYGWHNLVLAPEEAWHPRAFREILGAATPDVDVVGHVATGLATVAGLWRELPVSPVDDRRPPASGAVRVIRVFVRRVEAAEVEYALRVELADVSAGLPRPRANRTERVPAVADDAAAARAMADAVVRKHPELFAVSRVQPAPAPVQNIDWRQAVSMMLAFLVAALRRAPRQWAEGVVARASGGAARRLQGAIFGTGSAYSVVVNGRDGRGRLASVDQLLTGVHEVQESLQRNGVPADLSAPSTAAFWRDFVLGGLTLGDGEQHAADLPPASAGGRPAVVLAPAAIAPVEGAPFAVRGRVAQRVSNQPVEAYDILSLRRLRADLSQLVEDDPAVAVEAGLERDRLEAAVAAVRHSYAGRVGESLSRQIMDAQRDIGRFQAQLEQAAQAGELGQQERLNQGRLARQQIGMLSVLLLVLVVIIVLSTQHLLSWKAAVPLAIVSCGVWLVAATVAFVRAQAELFRLLHRRRELDDETQAALANLQAATRELYTGALLYRQYARWAPVLGAFLASPMGPVPPRAEDGRPLDGPLPRTFGLGHAVVDPAGTSRVVDRLAADLFPTGWLGRQWELLLADAPRRLGAAGLAIAEDPALLYADPVDRTDSPLEQWRCRLREDGTGAGQGEAFWGLVQQGLRHIPTAEMTGALLDRVEIVGQEAHGLGPEVSGGTFVDGLLAVATGPRAQSFDVDLFTPSALGRGAQRVEETVVLTAGRSTVEGADGNDAVTFRQCGEGQGLGQFLAVLQLGAGVPAAELTLAGERAEETPPETVPDLPPRFQL